MTGFRTLALASAMTAAAAVPARASSDSVAGDSALIAEALNGQTLQLTMRGTTVTVTATAARAEDGCATLIAVEAPATRRTWSRLLRWSEVAWAGTTPDGRASVSFFEHEGRLPADKLAVTPADIPAFQAALGRLVAGCRASRGEGERVLMSSPPAAGTCYFPRLPSLHLTDEPDATPRAVLTVLARENPHAELQLLLERAAAADGDDWGECSVAFTYADPQLPELRIGAATFALDTQPVIAEHTLTAYGDTRLRIAMDPSKVSAEGKRMQSFSRRLAASGEATLTLLDGAGQSRPALTFDTGPAIAAARRALTAAGWSCVGARTPEPPAANWQLQD